MAFKIPQVFLKRGKTERSNMLKGFPVTVAEDLKIIRTVGRGSFGAVKLCHKNHSELPVILKEMIAADDEEQRKLFIKEAKMLMSIAHINIAKFDSVFEPNVNENTFGFILEYLYFDFSLFGQDLKISSLKDFLKCIDEFGCQDFDHVQEIIAQDATRALDFLHDNNIVHRDIKPENILVSNQHYTTQEQLMTFWQKKPIVAKLIDFGESRSAILQTNSLVHTKTNFINRGTPVYMAPEIHFHNCNEDISLQQLKQADMWALGLIFYMLVNPDKTYPFEKEVKNLNKMGLQAGEQIIRRVLETQDTRPQHSPKYTRKRETVWKQLTLAFDRCVKYKCQERPKASQVLCQLEGYSYMKSDRNIFDDVVAHMTADISEHEVSGDSQPEPPAGSPVLSPVNQINKTADTSEDGVSGDSQPEHPAGSPVLSPVNQINKTADTSEKRVSGDSQPEHPAGSPVFSPVNQINKTADTSEKIVSGDSQPEHPAGSPVLSPVNQINKTADTSENGVSGDSQPEPPAGSPVLSPENQINKTADTSENGVSGDSQSEPPAGSPVLSPVNQIIKTADTSENGVSDNSRISEQPHVSCYDSEVSTVDCTTSRISETDKLEYETCPSIENWTNHDASEELPYGVDDYENDFFKSKITNRYRNTELDPKHWINCDTIEVESLPYDINGTIKFNIKANKETIMKVSKDGRPWDKWMNSSRKNLYGIRRVARCKGSYQCFNPSCDYMVNYGCRNKLQFQATSGVKVCFVCGAPADIVHCPAVKIWELEKTSKSVVIMHKGLHTCLPKKIKISKSVIKNAIEANPKSKPSKLVNDKLVSMMQSEFSWNDIEEVAEQFVDMKKVYNIRDEIKRDNNPYGEHFDALGLYKKKCDEKDKYFIYKMNNKSLNGSPSYVFKSSKPMAELAIQMSCDGDGLLKEEYAFVDAKHDRTKGFKTLTLWTYHPIARKVLCLAKMEVENENTENLVLFWQIFNEMLQKCSNNPTFVFNPTGFVCDENHANWNGIERVFGEAAICKTVSCEFHYKQSIQRHKRRVHGESGEKFSRLAVSILDALTISEFDKSCKELECFIEEYPFLQHWFAWWYERRTHIFKAFKPDDAPASNIAEIGHAKLQSVGRSYMSLLETAREDVILAIRQDAELRAFATGNAPGGKGPNQKERRHKQYQKGLKRAVSFANELEENLTTLPPKRKFVPKSGKHRPKDQVSGNQKLRSDNFKETELAPVYITDRPDVRGSDGLAMCYTDVDCMGCTGDADVNNPGAIYMERINAQLGELGREIEHVPGDGHCLLYAVSLGLTNEGLQPKTSDELCEILIEEISNNLDYYIQFANGRNVVEDIERYVRYKEYNNDTVDLILSALCNCLYVSAIIYNHTPTGVNILATGPGRRGVECVGVIYLVLSGGNGNEHYSGVKNV